MSETPYLESNAILAAQNGDRDQVQAVLDELLPGEVRALQVAAELLAEECGRRLGTLSGARNQIHGPVSGSVVQARDVGSVDFR